MDVGVASCQTDRLAHTSSLLVAWLVEYDEVGHHRRLSHMHAYCLREHLLTLHATMGALISELPEHPPVSD